MTGAGTGAGAVGDPPLLLTSLPPSRAQIRLATVAMAVLLAALVLPLPFARVPVGNSAILVPAYATAVLMTEVITAVLLFALYAAQRLPALLVLATGYLATALLIVPWALTFPGVAGTSGILDGGLQGTAVVAAARRVGFPLFVLAYALLHGVEPSPRHARRTTRAVVARCFAAALAGVGLLTALALTSDPRLPPFMTDALRSTPLWQAVPVLALAACAAALAVLWSRRRSVLDLWLTVVLFAWAIETCLLGFVSAGRFSVGWWAGRLYGLTSSSVVLFVLLAEMTALYARIVRSVAAERRVREARLTSLEALSASIAHEVNQPLASMVTNADAGLRWLDRPVPNLEEARAALARIAKDGHRAAKLIDCIRDAFRKAPQDRGPVNVNEQIREVLARTTSERRMSRVMVRADTDPNLPSIRANPVQLQQVLVNLIANAIDSLALVEDRPRLLRVCARRSDDGLVHVAVEDNGVGLDTASRGRLFEPFFTTKAHGIGMGLAICQSIVEAHGGRLWMTANHPHGAVFEFTLPTDDGKDGRNTAAPAEEQTS